MAKKISKWSESINCWSVTMLSWSVTPDSWSKTMKSWSNTPISWTVTMNTKLLIDKSILSAREDAQVSYLQHQSVQGTKQRKDN